MKPQRIWNSDVDLEEAEALVDAIDVRVIQVENLIERAVASYNAIRDPAKRAATTDEHPDFMRRIVGNFIRHECLSIDYDATMRTMPFGVAECLFRRKVDLAIRAAYPELA